MEPNPLTWDNDQWPSYSDYQPLDPAKREIRLLEICRLKSSNLVSCEILHQSLDDSPKYSALSYNWGAPSAVRDVLVNGTKIKIRKTLHRFLGCLCSRFGTIIVWLDAHCINQKDVKERSWQVSLMGDIYESAENVYAWLGHGDADPEYALEQVTELRLRGELNPQHMQSLRQYLPQLFLRPYWNRVWVIQEAVLAKKFWLLYGHQMAIWEDVVTAFERMPHVEVESAFKHIANQEETEAFSRFSRFQRAKTLLQNRESDIVDLAVLFKHSRCKDPRDKLYGLRGIASNGSLLQVDYSKSPVQVFFEALSLNKPHYLSWNKFSSALTDGIELCYCFPMFRSDILCMMQNPTVNKLYEWLTFDGTVTRIVPMDSQRPQSYILSEDKEAGIYCSHSVIDTVTLGDLIYLSQPSYKSFPLRFTFRTVNAHSKAIQLLHNDLGDVDGNVDYDDHFEKACIGNLEVCHTNAGLMQSIPDALLVHISPVMILALLARYSPSTSEAWPSYQGDGEIPKYIKDFVRSRDFVAPIIYVNVLQMQE